MAGFKWLQLLQEKCFPQKRNFVWSIMIFLRLLRYFCRFQSKKKRTETVLVWSVSEICFSHQQNVNVKGSTFLLTTPSLLSLVLEGMKPHEILFIVWFVNGTIWWIEICYNVYCLLFIIWTKTFYDRDIK